MSERPRLPIVVDIEEDILPRWRRIFAADLPAAELLRFGEPGSREAQAAVVWNPPDGALQAMPALRFVLSRGAGVDGLLRPGRIPDDAVLLRMVDPAIAEKMAEFAVLAVLHLHRGWQGLTRAQAEGRWIGERASRPAASRTVGLMGLGTLGRLAAERLRPFGFKLRGWSRSPQSLPGVETFAGAAALAEFAARCDVLVCLLPLTPETEGIVDADLLARLNPGALFVNAGRGGHVVEADLLAALDAGHIEAAILDVTREEPLPPPHAFWTHPSILLTQHGAAVMTVEEEARAAARILAQALAGRDPPERVVRDRGY